MRRRDFIITLGAAVGVAALPLPVESYVCSCGLMTFFRQPEGHFASTHYAGQRLNYGLHMQHVHLHRLPRLRMLMEIGKHRRLTDGEKAELQTLFVRVAENDARAAADCG